MPGARFFSKLLIASLTLTSSPLVGSSGVAAEVVVQQTADGAEITADGKPFAGYRILSGHQPVIWPIHGPAGQAMTRQYPLGEKLPAEKDDHPHHRSLWFNHGDVNGGDFWMEPQSDSTAGGDLIRHRKFVELESLGDSARIVTINDWVSAGKKQCEDLRTIIFSDDADGRWIDFSVVVTASEGELVFGDTKEGAFGIRVPGELDVDAKRGGQIINSRGETDENAWGRPAEWVDYQGTVDGEPAGIVIFDMPDSFRHPTRWHVRTYGLFAANPFAAHDFPPGEPVQGPVTLAQDEQLKLHYRVLFYSGKRSAEQIKAIYHMLTATSQR